MILRRVILNNRLGPCCLSIIKRCEQTSNGSGGVSETGKIDPVSTESESDFETVFTMPYIRHFALYNRLKVYTAAGTVGLVATCSIFTAMNVIPIEAAIVGGYIGLTSTLVLSVSSLLTRNIIGFLYISHDNKYLKISTVDYWGLRRNKVVPVEDWVPLNDLPARNTDILFLSPRLDSDPTPMKLVPKLGIVLNKTKVGQFLE